VPHPESWFNLTTLRRFHSAMFDRVWDWAGQFRTAQTNIGHPPHLILGALQDLRDDVLYWLSVPGAMSPLDQAARVHHRLVAIHPFPNGNGRFARLIADRYMKFLGCRLPDWPTNLQDDVSARSNYIAALRTANRGDYCALLEYMRRYGAEG
jgi:Fic-DOC domain mobile mystery protein B